MKRLIYSVLLALLCIGLGHAQQRREWPREPFKTDTLMVHDPVMAYEDGTYYIYSTGMGIGTATSKDLKTWTVYPEGVLKDQIPTWTQDSVPGFKRHIWAPDIHQQDAESPIPRLPLGRLWRRGGFERKPRQLEHHRPEHCY